MKIVLSYSGGMDSTALLYDLVKKGHSVYCLGVNYGQRHRKELDAARGICASAEVPFEIADLVSVSHLLGGSALTSPEIDVPEGHYTDVSMKATVVPNRNMILLSIALGWATSMQCDHVAYAAHSGDHPIYPDCRPEFVAALDAAARLASWRPVTILSPFLRKTKSDIVKIGTAAGAPFEQTWSCYKGGDRHCGKCGTCVERREAFQLAAVTDPTVYAA